MAQKRTPARVTHMCVCVYVILYPNPLQSCQILLEGKSLGHWHRDLKVLGEPVTTVQS